MKQKNQTNIKNKLLFVACLAFLLAIALSFSASAALTSASIRKVSDSNIQNVFYYSSGNGYKDNVGSTPDVKLRVCTDTASDISGKNVAAFYAIAPTNNSLFLYDILGGDTIARFIPLGSTFTVGSDTCAEANFEFFAGRSPYPAVIFVAVDSNTNAGENIDFGTDLVIAVPTGNGYLPSGISRNNVQATYNQITGNVVIDGTGTSPGVSQTSSNKLLIGSCLDSQGVTCTDTARSSLSASGVTLWSGVVSPPDSITTTRYSVLNGYGAPYCIGPDVDLVSISANPSAGPKGTLVTLNASVRNVNNVDITTSFTVEFWVGGNNVCNGTITNSGANPLQAYSANTKYATCVWDTSSAPTGTSTITGFPRDALAGIADCNNNNDNGTGTWSTQRFWTIITDINQTNNTNVFPDTGRPYNLTVHVNNTDGVPIDVEVRVTEENGMGNVFAPFQTNVTPTSTVSRATGSVLTQNGSARLVVVPTGSKAHFEPELAYLNVSSYVGNYSIYIELFDKNQPNANNELPLFVNGSPADKYYFTINNPIPRTPTTAEEDSVSVINNNIFKQLFGLVLGPWSDGTKWLK